MWEEGSCDCCPMLVLVLVLQCSWTLAVVSALGQRLVVWTVSTVARLTVCVAIAGSAQRLLPSALVGEKLQRGTYWLLTQPSHHQRTRADLRLRAATASAPLQAGTAVTVAVVAGTGTRPAVGVRCRAWAQRRSTQDNHEAAVAGSRPSVVVAGTPRAPVHCRVPCWQDALPWRKFKSRGTAEAA